MTRPSVRRGARAAVGAMLTPLTIAALVVAPAGALGNARADGCRPFVAAKARVDAAAAHRETTLNLLVSTLDVRRDPWSMNMGQITALRAAASDVAALDAHVQSACYATVAALRSDALPLLTNYRVYWLRVPQSHAIEAADRLGEARAALGRVASRLAALAGSNTATRGDLDAMNRALGAADAQLGTAPTASSVMAALPALSPAADMSADVGAMQGARAALIAARGSLVEARTSGLRVVADLGA